jgi:PHD/YefM family antitoxin component YafN of YafNO toxin-antitoxin module
MVNVLQIGNVGTELSKLVHQVSDRQTQIVIESEGKPVVAMIHYDYLVNLLEALEDAIDSKVLKQAVTSNDEFFGFEQVISAHNIAHNVEVRLEDFAKV